MVNPTETKKTTIGAVSRITNYLEKDDHVSALFLCYVYCNIRLRSLLARKLALPDNIVSVETLNSTRLNFGIALTMCKAAGLITDSQFNDLKELQTKRNSLAHESILWRELEKPETPGIEHVCRHALQFLHDTTEQ